MATDYTRARRHLMRADPALGHVIRQVGPCRLQDIPDWPPFMALAEAIASQQLSVKAADTIFARFCSLFPDGRPSPAHLATLADDAIRGVGFSRSKVVFLRDLAAHVLEERLSLDTLHQHDDETVLQSLTAVKGIGRWTAEIYLMFRLKRPDVFPADDLGLLKAAQRVYGLRARPTPKRLLRMADRWRPYRSVAAWYLWRSLSLLPGADPPRTRKGVTRKPARRPTGREPGTAKNGARGA
jgi:3-methyladenine DNA glycosylase/8-oxoguanine DNA glycosylase